MALDFLPVCDLLFNFISVASYFCDVAFDVIVIYTLYQSEVTSNWCLVLVVACIVSLFACQIVSIKWHIDDLESGHQTAGWPSQCMLVAVHLMQCGVLWRYSRLLCTPVEIRTVKREMRNLCLLRMIHAFVQAVPFVMAQGYLLATRTHYLSQVNYVSMALSLFNVCWALASFNKNIRSQNIDRLVLTWIGVIVQLLWRLGTLTSRCVSLVIYASAYHLWILLVAALHWLCMFLWLVIPKSQLFHKQDKAGQATKAAWSLMLSLVYVFCYINVEDTRTKPRVLIFYTVMLLENVLLVSLWAISVKASLDYDHLERRNIIIAILVLFFSGVAFMVLYYSLFHVSKLPSEAETGDGLNEHQLDQQHQQQQHQQQHQQQQHHQQKMFNTEKYLLPVSTSANQAVFNCALHPAMMKKKKLPSVLPPPPPPPNPAVADKAEVPFWKEPLPDGRCSPQPRLSQLKPDIRQKIQCKRESQLRHLQDIETEIRSGRLQRPSPPSGRDPVRSDVFPPGCKWQPYLSQHLHLAGGSGYDSSGEQGDVDSCGEEWPAPRRLPADHRHHQPQTQRRTFETPL